MEIQTNCEFSGPVEISAGSSSAAVFSKLNCTTTDPAILKITDGTNTAYISQTWDFGTLFISFLFVVCILVVIFKDFFFFFFHQFVQFVKSAKYKL